MGAYLGVAAGSAQPLRFIHLTYAGDPARASAELGRLYLDFYARHAMEALSDAWQGRLPYAQTHSPLWPLRHAFMSSLLGRLFEAMVPTRASPV